MRTSTRTLTPTALLLLSACAYDPEPSTDEDLLARIEALEEQIAELEVQVSNGITLLTESRTVTVSDVAGLEAALDELDHYRLARDVTYTIALEDGTYSITGPISVNHPDGDRLLILGASEDRDAVVLSFSGSSGVVLEGDRTLGYLGYVTLEGDSSEDSAGVDAGGGASVGLGPVAVSGFSYGIRARENATITDLALNGGSFEISNCTYGVFSSAAAYVGLGGLNISGGTQGVTAQSGSVMVTDGAQVTSVIDAGFTADQGAILLARGEALADQCGKSGFTSASGATLIASGATASNNGEHGFISSWGAFLDAFQGTSETNISAGYAVRGGAVMYADEATSTRNNDGFYSTTSHLNAQYCVATENRYGFTQSYRGSIHAVGCAVSGNTVSDYLEEGVGDSYIYY